jgi:phosphotransferase system  glucose/maltose/N-acetylglucosamine-specific IIC component
MLFVDMLFVMVVAISFIPILTGYCAHSRGRSFWLWFVLGWVLPLVSFFLLFALIARDELTPSRRLRAEAKQILREAEEAAARIKAEKR